MKPGRTCGFRVTSFRREQNPGYVRFYIGLTEVRTYECHFGEEDRVSFELQVPEKVFRALVHQLDQGNSEPLFGLYLEEE